MELFSSTRMVALTQKWIPSIIGKRANPAIYPLKPIDYPVSLTPPWSLFWRFSRFEKGEVEKRANIYLPLKWAQSREYVHIHVTTFQPLSGSNNLSYASIPMKYDRAFSSVFLTRLVFAFKQSRWHRTYTRKPVNWLLIPVRIHSGNFLTHVVCNNFVAKVTALETETTVWSIYSIRETARRRKTPVGAEKVIYRRIFRD